MLVSFNEIEFCFKLAANHGLYEIMVQLLSKLPESARKARITNYIAKFGNNFAHVLYDSYVAAEDYTSLMCADQLTLEEYLKGHPEVAWIHYIEADKFVEASNTLWDIASDSNSLDSQRLASSLSLLCFLAENSAGDVQAHADSIDFIEVQSSIQQDLQAEGIEQTMNTYYKCGAALREYVRSILLRVIEGKACKIEQIVDISTLHGKYEYLETGLGILNTFEMTPENLHLFWMRVYTSTDWSRLSESHLIRLIRAMRDDDTLKLLIMPDDIQLNVEEFNQFDQMRSEVEMDQRLTQAIGLMENEMVE
jgi:Non-repetitive/WGA-negative nucleoporin C-terminal